ncbi:ATP synthase beta subunit C-terminal domain-containing protein [Exiguobacterium flavidum]|uniref:ATP synthase beta subunit C-terminal domain-containing protein n=1 Tax=Exiguobacterium flavidum TaxID=2184695 RepID=UPI000DF77C40|nr:hypothetical protein [Exiguobacterium flavidum]
MDDLQLNVRLLRSRVPNLTVAAKGAGLRPATVSNLCTGKIPVGRAEVRTIVTLATLAKCSLDELIIRGEKKDMIQTNIKTLDLFAPIVKGGTVGLIARPKMGQLVVLIELFHRLKKEGLRTILLSPENHHPEIEDLVDLSDITARSIDEAIRALSDLSRENDVLFVADRSHVVSGDLYDLEAALPEHSKDRITTFLLDLTGGAMDEELPYGPLDTVWHFDPDLSARHLYPAVNPVLSTSSLLEGGLLDPQHVTLKLEAQKLLRRYRELRSIVQVRGIDGIPSSDQSVYARGERLEAYLTQPFYVAEDFTGIKGESVSFDETARDVRKILDGSADSLPVKSLAFTGQLSI